MPAVLFVLTSADKTVQGNPTGWYLPEAAHPYQILAPHATIDFASPNGPNPPIDPNSVNLYAKDCINFLKDENVKAKLANAKKLSEVNASDYDAIFYVGGHGPVIDLPEDQVNIKLASEFWKLGKIVSAVCHGPAALVNVTDPNGESIFKGRQSVGFTNAEEEAMDTVKDVPFLLESKIKSLGGKFEKASELWKAHVVKDGQLYTGQNPNSAAPLAEEILKALQA